MDKMLKNDAPRGRVSHKLWPLGGIVDLTERREARDGAPLLVG